MARLLTALSLIGILSGCADDRTPYDKWLDRPAAHSPSLFQAALPVPWAGPPLPKLPN